MSPIFADTYYFIGLLNPDDQAHGKASEYSKLVDQIVTTEWVMLELADGLSDTENRKLFKDFRGQMLANSRIEIVPLEMATHLSAIDLYSQRPDKGWSLTDCVSFLVMQDRGLTDALTADHHFEQAGFVALLK